MYCIFCLILKYLPFLSNNRIKYYLKHFWLYQIYFLHLWVNNRTFHKLRFWLCWEGWAEKFALSVVWKAFFIHTLLHNTREMERYAFVCIPLAPIVTSNSLCILFPHTNPDVIQKVGKNIPFDRDTLTNVSYLWVSILRTKVQKRMWTIQRQEASLYKILIRIIDTEEKNEDQNYVGGRSRSSYSRRW